MPRLDEPISDARAEAARADAASRSPRPRRAHGPRRILKGLALALLGVLLALAGTEAALRIAKPAADGPARAPFGEDDGGRIHVRSQVPGLAYEMAPGRSSVYQGVAVRTNALGMRDDEVATPRPPGELRIAAVGDSVTFGWGVDASQAWPAVLERALGGRGACDVLDLGVSGYSTRDEAIVVRAKALPLEPDAIVVGYFLNDPESEAISPLHAWFRDEPWWRSTRIATLVARHLRQRDARRLGGGNFYRWVHAREGAPWKSALAAFADVAEATRARGVPVLVAVFPTWLGYASLDAYPYADLHAQVVEAVEEAGLEALDLLPAFRASGRTVAELKVDDEHPSAAGHAVAADAIRRRLEELGWTHRRR